MIIGDFEIICTNCGSEDLVIVDVHKDSDFDEDFKRLKCADCHAETEI